MNEGRQAFLGILLALLSSALILGSSMLSLVENRIGQVLAPPNTPTIDEFMPTMVFVVPSQPTSSALAISLFTDTPEPTFPPLCTPLPGWVTIVVLPGDTLYSLAYTYQITPEELAFANCLWTDTLQPGWTVVVPNRPPTATPTPTATRPFASCGPPPDWVVYEVRPGDTLYYLSTELNVSVEELRHANCMQPNDSQIYVGQKLYVPFIPPPRPTNPPGSTSTPFPTRTNTSTQPSASATPTPTGTRVISTATSTSTQAAPTPTSTTSTMPPTSTATLPPSPPTSTPVQPPYPYPD